jgi:hypothetical protein
VPAAAAQRMRELHLAAENVELVMTQIYKSDFGLCVCDKTFGKKEDNFHFPIRARYAS